jgi:biotin synthase
VDWPLYPLEEIIERAKNKDQIHRVCISMITHPKALEDTLNIIQILKEETDLSISVLISPTLVHREESLVAMKKAGADRVGIAIDAATLELFDQLRGCKGFRKILCWDPSHCRSGRDRERNGGSHSERTEHGSPHPSLLFLS